MGIKPGNQIRSVRELERRYENVIPVAYLEAQNAMTNREIADAAEARRHDAVRDAVDEKYPALREVPRGVSDDV